MDVLVTIFNIIMTIIGFLIVAGMVFVLLAFFAKVIYAIIDDTRNGTFWDF